MHANIRRVVSTFDPSASSGKISRFLAMGAKTRPFCYVGGLVGLMKTTEGVIGLIKVSNPNEFTMVGLAEMITELTNRAREWSTDGRLRTI